MAGGWTCSDTDCKKFNGYATSSLVKSNFKFTKDKQPICTRCWNMFGYWHNNGVKETLRRVEV
jgi:hypothetical protein